MREFEQHVAVYLHLLTMLAHFLFRALELIVRSHEFGRALGHIMRVNIKVGFPADLVTLNRNRRSYSRLTKI